MPVIEEWRGHVVDVAIVGAGAAGLAAARHLQQARPDLSLLVLEAGGRLGGRAWTIKPASLGEPIDLGCGWLHGAQDNDWTRIAGESGFTLDRTPAPWNDDRYRLGLNETDGSDAETAIAAYFERLEQHSGDPDGTLADMLEPGNRWNGRIEAFGTYINGATLAEASIADYNRYDPGPPPDWRVREGYGALIAAYGAPVPVLLNTEVTRIDHGSANGVRLTTNRGQLSARAVLVSVSTNMLAQERITFEPPLPDKLAAAAALPLGLANKLFLQLASPDDLPADARLIGAPSAARTAGYQIRPFGRACIEAYFGGPLAHNLEQAGEAASVAFATDELARQYGSDIKSRLTKLALSAWARTPHINGSYSYAKPGHAGARAILSAPVDGRLFFCGEACSAARFSTAHGAYETGVAAAAAILKGPNHVQSR